LDAETCQGFNEHNKLLTTPLSVSWFLSLNYEKMLSTMIKKGMYDFYKVRSPHEITHTHTHAHTHTQLNEI
jgi:hypothetical protein